MKKDLTQWLACPICSGILDLSVEKEQTKPGFAGVRQSEVMEGNLTCQQCGLVFPISEGIPRLLPEHAEFSNKENWSWTTFDSAERVWEETFRDFISPLGPNDMLGKLVLDAGCGNGRHSWFAAEYGAVVVAMDSSSEAVDAAFKNTANLANVHIVQGDLLRPPFRTDTFDRVFCLGVLHHLENPAEAFHRLATLLKQRGTLSTWVYGPRQGVAAAVTNVTRSVTTRLQADNLYKVSVGIASGLRVFSHTPNRLLKHVPIMKDIVALLPVHEHHQWPFRVVVADVFDRLRIPVTNTFTGEELERMYDSEGFSDIQVSRRIGNNESFRGLGIRR